MGITHVDPIPYFQPGLGAICLPESACRELCSLRNDCFGIDVFLGGNRCFLNVEGTAPDGCKSQFETANLGPSTSYKFLAKAGTTVERMLQDGTGLSSDDILRFMPVSFESGGSYKVCFCDSALLPAGQQYSSLCIRLRGGVRAGRTFGGLILGCIDTDFCK